MLLIKCRVTWNLSEGDAVNGPNSGLFQKHLYQSMTNIKCTFSEFLGFILPIYQRAYHKGLPVGT